MNARDFNLNMLLAMRHSPIYNYAIPGVTSYLIGQKHKHGTLRLFECSREHQEPITPHSHRFDFQCWVLSGSVKNRIWRESYAHDQDADEFQVTTLNYGGEVGQYAKLPGKVGRWRYTDRIHSEGECYSMRSHEVHSIFFSRGTKVLFFEGATVSDSSIILEPVVNGKPVPTFKIEPWMFDRIGPARICDEVEL